MLVTEAAAQCLPLPGREGRAALRGLVNAVASGGTLLVVGQTSRA